jgi:hypothetical protein
MLHLARQDRGLVAPSAAPATIGRTLARQRLGIGGNSHSSVSAPETGCDRSGSQEAEGDDADAVRPTICGRPGVDDDGVEQPVTQVLGEPVQMLGVAVLNGARGRHLNRQHTTVIAADVLAPARMPRQVVVLARSGTFDSGLMVPVADLDEASVVLKITDDVVIHAFAARSTWWDVAHGTGPDVHQAATGMQAMLDRSWR